MYIVYFLICIRGRGGLVVGPQPWSRRVPGPKPNSSEDPPCMGPPARQIICGGQTSSRWCGVKIPTLARPTQEGCKAGRGPAGREPLHQHVEDGIYWVQ
ncbi:hypothetical protein AVEN_71222-1 [Araneus ventricosus]|uniref:Uncharacterized protein n=1 Tax=Araneus ventricosus TaxID=182803 RepID=A0A4Y2IRX3_ARAVE|nr:hypothetical protein AVEN_71222-1 [Araneus ventricosus]